MPLSCRKIRRRSSLSLACALLLLSACHRSTRVVVTPPPLPPAPAKVSLTTFEKGEQEFRSGDYEGAARLYEAYLRQNPRGENVDKSLFRLGLSSALSTAPSRTGKESESAFKRLVAEYPNSPYAREAQFILKLEDQIERLKTDVKERDERMKRLAEELQKLKDIDMQRRPAEAPNR